jgi:hypothetical protein
LSRLEESTRNLKIKVDKKPSQEKVDTQQDKAGQEKKSIPFSGLVAHLVVSFISQTLRQFPIIEQTPLLRHVVTFNQPPEFALLQGFFYLFIFAKK